MFDAHFDGHKLMYHPREVARWLETGATAAPLYTELELCNRCNCRCTFCGAAHAVGAGGGCLEPAAATQILDDLAAMGGRSVMFCGHGEPLLHPQAREIIRHAAGRLSLSVTTNGLALTADKLDLIDGLEWIRFSINGCDPENYAAIHGTGAGMFGRALAHLALAVERKRRRGLAVTIGVQLVLLEENAAGVPALAARVKALGADYFSVKPYSRHPLSPHALAPDFERHRGLEAQCRALEDASFRISFRAGSAAKLGQAKPYGRCLGTPFMSFISADGDVWECQVFAGDARFRTGNAAREGLRAVWAGARRREVLAFLERGWDLGACRDVCRLDECNRYLWRLRHPRPHDNFI